VVHGDLTGSNILINAEGKPCLCDFGLSKIMVEFEGTSYFTGTRGAVRWAASELYRGNDDEDYVPVINKECDIYSFGSVMLQVLSGKIPYYYFKRDGQVVIQLHHGITPKRPNITWVTDKVWDFIEGCWAEPMQRPTIGEVRDFVRHYRAGREEPSNTAKSDVEPSRSSKLTGSNLYYDVVDTSVDDTPLIERETSMSNLRAEYKSQDSSSAFLGQIDWLIDNGCDYVRRTKDDGNSLYRSVGYAFIERVVNMPDDMELAKSTLQSTRPLFEIVGIEPPVYEDLLKIILSIIQQTVTPDPNGEKLTADILLEAFQSVEVSNSVVLYFRLLTSAQIRADPDSYEPFLFDFQMKPVEFCETLVEPMGVDADDIQIAALSRALGVTIQVARLQGQQMGDNGFDFEPFGNARGPYSPDPIVILRRPAHFELLYSSQS